ncbi:uncharacterized protein [Prorops nasuta]|uniref:uncharacterized protein n=1 Tax=Prorops nasuta TaxID=863751 RepID=UPI0034D01732
MEINKEKYDLLIDNGVVVSENNKLLLREKKTGNCILVELNDHIIKEFQLTISGGDTTVHDEIKDILDNENETTVYDDKILDNVDNEHDSSKNDDEILDITDTENNNILKIDEKGNRNFWKKENFIFLIDAIKELDDEFSNGVKRMVWSKISKKYEAKGHKILPKTIEIKWKSLIKTYKNIKQKNNTSGENRRTWEFYTAMNDYMEKKPEITPIATISSITGLKVNQDCSSSYRKVEPTIKKRKINDKERRHQDKMDRLDKFNFLFEKMLDKM